MLAALSYVPYPSWLNTGDNTWQMTAATFVGPDEPAGLGRPLCLHRPEEVGGQRAGDDVRRVLAGPRRLGAVVLQDGLRLHLARGRCPQRGPDPAHGSGTGWKHFFENFVGKPGQITNAVGEQGQAVSAANTAIPFHFPTDSLAYFQFVFAAITPLLFLGSVLGRIKFSAWCLLVPLWSTFVYASTPSCSGAVATSPRRGRSTSPVVTSSTCRPGCRGSWPPGSSDPRLLRDRQNALPNNLVMAAVGAGILWLGWNGFNGGDPYYAGADAAAAVVNTNLATAVGVLTWMGMDAWLSKAKKPTFLGGGQRHDLRPGRHHAVCRLGERLGRHRCRRSSATAIVWIAWNYLSKVRPFSKVDDALGVVYTHGIAGFFGGMMLGIFADPNMVEYGCGHLNAAGQVVEHLGAS